MSGLVSASMLLGRAFSGAGVFSLIFCGEGCRRVGCLWRRSVAVIRFCVLQFASGDCLFCEPSRTQFRVYCRSRERSLRSAKQRQLRASADGGYGSRNSSSCSPCRQLFFATAFRVRSRPAKRVHRKMQAFARRRLRPARLFETQFVDSNISLNILPARLCPHILRLRGSR